MAIVDRFRKKAETELTAELVRELLRDQPPDLADRPLMLGARGWDNQLWRLGDDLAVRLPWQTETADSLLLGHSPSDLVRPSVEQHACACEDLVEDACRRLDVGGRVVAPDSTGLALARCQHPADHVLSRGREPAGLEQAAIGQ